MTSLSGLPNGTYMIQVRSGRHAGAEIPLDAGTYLLGAGSSADIVLTDDGVAPGHVELRFEGEFCRFWSLDGAIRLPGRQLNPGVRGESKLPADIGVAGVELTLLPPALPRAKPTPWRRRVLLGIGGLVVLAGGAGLVLSGSVPAFSTPAHVAAAKPAAVTKDPAVLDVTPVSLKAPEQTIPEPAIPEQAAPAAAGNDAVADAAQALKARLDKAGLAGRVTVSMAGSVIEAEGTLSPAQKKTWLQAQMWFDQTYKGRFPLVHQVRVEEDAASPQLAIQAIWAGAGPYVIGSDGEKYGEGATLPGGWRVERIERDQVIVSKNGERVSLIP